MINIQEVLETNNMIEKENLDVRTITLGISLLDCIDSDLDRLNEKIYDKITKTAKDLVAVGEAIEKEFGIPIVNKRISVTPIALVGGAACKTSDDFVTIAKTLDRARKDVGVNFLGGYSALVSKGMTKADELFLRSIPKALAETQLVCSSVNLGSTKTGIDMDAVRLMGDIIKETAELTKENDSIGCSKMGIPFGIVDLSLAPTPAIGDSVADILCEIGLEYAGAPGTTAALALLNDQVKKGGVMASSYVGGLSGAFIPVSEDQGMIDAVNAGALTLEKLEAMTCVCSVGLDMIAIPGDTKATTISGIIADELAIGMINQKTTAVRIIPVIGKTVGDNAEFGGLLGHAPIMPVNRFSCDAFVNRGGRIPAPIHSFKN